MVEFIDGDDQTNIPFLDQIGHGEAVAIVLIGHTEHQTQIGADEIITGDLSLPQAIFQRSASLPRQAPSTFQGNSRASRPFAQLLRQLLFLLKGQ